MRNSKWLWVILAAFVAAICFGSYAWTTQQFGGSPFPVPTDAQGAVSAMPMDPLERAETDMVAYLEADAYNRQFQLLRLEYAADELDRHSYDPNSQHYKYYVDWARRELGQSHGVDTYGALDIATFTFFFERENPAKVLRDLQSARTHRLSHDKLAQAYHQVAIGLSSESRGLQIRDHLLQYVDHSWIRGKVIADIGAGNCQAEPELVNLVGPTGKVIAVDVDPSTKRFFENARDHIPALSQVEFRLTDYASPGLRPNEVDIVVLNDVHLLGIYPDDSRGEERFKGEQLPWLKSVFRALRPGGILFIRENGGACPPIEHVTPYVARGGLTVKSFPQTNRYQDGRTQEGFVILATKQ